MASGRQVDASHQVIESEGDESDDGYTIITTRKIEAPRTTTTSVAKRALSSPLLPIDVPTAALPQGKKKTKLIRIPRRRERKKPTLSSGPRSSFDTSRTISPPAAPKSNTKTNHFLLCLTVRLAAARNTNPQPWVDFILNRNIYQNGRERESRRVTRLASIDQSHWPLTVESC